jgi:N-acetylglucosamine-6-phosphate deacetylase
MFTHVGNGCPMLLDRHDNIIQRALSLAQSLWLCFIADDVHVPCVALGNYLRTAGIDRCIVVTDAISAAGLGQGRYSFGSQVVEVDEKLVARIPGVDTHLAGSAVTMPRSAQNLADVLGLTGGEIDSLTSLNARQLLQI